MSTNNRGRRRRNQRREQAVARARDRRRAASTRSGTSDVVYGVVAGEPLEVLVRALLQFKWRTRSDGMMAARARLEPDLGAPLKRALMRIEAELLLADADVVGTDDDEQRTHAQRGADALLELVQRIGRDCAEGRIKV